MCYKDAHHIQEKAPHQQIEIPTGWFFLLCKIQIKIFWKTQSQSCYKGKTTYHPIVITSSKMKTIFILIIALMMKPAVSIPRKSPSPPSSYFCYPLAACIPDCCKVAFCDEAACPACYTDQKYCSPSCPCILTGGLGYWWKHRGICFLIIVWIES